jgi:transposase
MLCKPTYEIEPVSVELDISQALSIDLGTSANLMAGVDTYGNSFGSSLGRKSNQQFVQMPKALLKERIKQLCEVCGIRYVETEEANTSCASYLDGDTLPEHGKKPDGWTASGRRIKRGLYRTKNGSLVNADLQASANILRKVAMT